MPAGEDMPETALRSFLAMVDGRRIARGEQACASESPSESERPKELRGETAC